MLYALEERLAAALTAALPRGIQVVTGPPAGPPVDTDERLEVTAPELWVELPPVDALGAREPAALVHVQRWGADGAVRDFTLPAGIHGEVMDVESPPGRPVHVGEDYQLDGATLRFHRPPAQAAEAVVATVRLGRTRGYQERRPFDSQLSVTAWATSFPRVDELLEMALAAILPADLDTGTIEARYLGASGVRMRLLQTALLLQGITRARVQIGNRWAPNAAARLRLVGHVELSVAVGQPPPEGRIVDLRYKLERPR